MQIWIFLHKLPTQFQSGGLAGLAVDVTLFPIDTIKTRLQSENGFRKSGGFSGMYNGLGAVVAGSVPTAALFFFSYEMFKTTVGPLVDKKYTPLVHLAAASIGEVVSVYVTIFNWCYLLRIYKIGGMYSKSTYRNS